MKYLLALLVAALLFTACKKDNISAGNTQQAPSVTRLPFEGIFTTTAEVLQPPPMLNQKITGTGYVTHLGESTFIALASIAIQPPPPFVVTGTATFIAANGDEFYTRFSGTSVPGVAGTSTATLRHTVTGGIGKFRNASGDFTGVSVVNPALPANSVTYNGWISY